MVSSEQRYKDLCILLSLVESPKEASMLLKDLLTPQECDALSERWQLVRLLSEGVTQREISKKLDISISTVTRGSRALQYGSGGFQYFLKKFKEAS